MFLNSNEYHLGVEATNGVYAGNVETLGGNQEF